ncbi:MAG: HTH-type transcriptional regulator CymR [bacterium ADurb.Bin400]|nr:MAG: HTH-type transcriptional regulator CymR [bacterium ADurb.Bin400]
MRISTKTYYGLRALINLVNRDEVSAIADIAYDESIPTAYLEKIFQQLKKAGILDSKRGSMGGYYFKLQPDKVTVKDVFEALGENHFDLVCLANGDQACPRQQQCVAQNVWKRLEQSIGLTLDAVTLKEIASH